MINQRPTSFLVLPFLLLFPTNTPFLGLLSFTSAYYIPSNTRRSPWTTKTTTTTTAFSFSKTAIVSSSLFSSFSSLPIIERPQNEFSRTYVVNDINTNSIKLSANQKEMADLAKRFSIPSISKLNATLSLKRERSNKYGSGVSIIIDGYLNVTYAQTCVRTDDNFNSDKNIDLFAIVKSPEEDIFGGYGTAVVEEERPRKRGGNSGRKKKKSKRNKQEIRGDQYFDEVRVEDLVKQFNTVEDFDDIDNELFEDPAVLDVDGVLDVGELAAQFLGLSLDPLPKKPGTEPMEFTLS